MLCRCFLFVAKGWKNTQPSLTGKKRRRHALSLFLVRRERVEGLKGFLGDLGECVSGWKALVGSQ